MRGEIVGEARVAGVVDELFRAAGEVGNLPGADPLRNRQLLFVDLAEKVVQAFDIDASGADPSISYDLE